MLQKFTVYIMRSDMHSGEEVALTLWAESRKDAERKAQEWFLKEYYSFSAEKGSANLEDISNWTRLVTIDKNGHQRERRVKY